jgi:hypothetical protein
MRIFRTGAPYNILSRRLQWLPISSATGERGSRRTSTPVRWLNEKTQVTARAFSPSPFSREGRCTARASRIRRRSRLRQTAEYALLDTANPIRSSGSGAFSTRTKHRTSAPSILRPEAKTRRNAACPRNACRRRFTQLPFVTHCQLVPPLRAPARQHLPAVLRRHPLAEAVRVLPLSLVWLIRSLHASSLLTAHPLGGAGPKKRGSPPPGNPLHRSAAIKTAEDKRTKTPPKLQRPGKT